LPSLKRGPTWKSGDVQPVTDALSTTARHIALNTENPEVSKSGEVAFYRPRGTTDLPSHSLD
jgi:hypothetical protein